jgi:hypothetical protein
MEIKRNKFIKTVFLQTGGEENHKFNLQKTSAGILISYSIPISLNSKYPRPKAATDMTYIPKERRLTFH